MKAIAAQFRRRWQPSRVVMAALTALVVCAASAVGAAIWEQHRIALLRAQITQLIEDERNVHATTPRSVPIYDASARLFLRERAAAWAPMLRTLESGSMIGVTPSMVEFNATDGSAHVELDYSDSTVLIDYLGRINEGVSPGLDRQRWTVVETRALSGGPPPTGSLAGTARVGDSVASIRSSWIEPDTPVSP